MRQISGFFDNYNKHSPPERTYWRKQSKSTRLLLRFQVLGSVAFNLLVPPFVYKLDTQYDQPSNNRCRCELVVAKDFWCGDDTAREIDPSSPTIPTTLMP